jgi:glucokinase
MRLFVHLYGAEAGNLALKVMATGGVYIGGGIGPKILPYLQDGGFMDRFIAKGRYQSILANIPVKLILNPKSALLGAAHHASQLV